MHFELRNLCLYDPETEEMVQMSYLTDIDNVIGKGALIKHFGSLEKIGLAKNKAFLDFGIYPVVLSYEKNGKTVRSRENVLQGFRQEKGNIYQVSDSNIGYIWRMCQRSKAA